MALTATLDADATPEEVRFRFTVENAGTDAVTLRFPTSQTAEVTVADERGETVWRYGEGRMFAQALREETLEPGESSVAELAWEDPDPGEYTAEATLEATPAVSATTRVSV